MVFYSQRNWGVNTLYPDTFAQPGIPTLGPVLYSNHMGSYLLRMTAQVSQKNKVGGSYNYLPRFRPRISSSGGFITPGDRADAMLTNKTVSPFIIVAKWTSTLTNEMLLEAGYSIQDYNYNQYYGELTAPGAIRKVDTVLGNQWNAGPGNSGFFPRNSHLTGKFSYVTGTHSIKAGGEYNWGYTRNSSNMTGDLVQQYANGVPFQVSVSNTPIPVVQSDADGNIGLFVQDSWTLDRLTLNGGFRFDYIKNSVPAQSAPAGTFVPARNFEAITDLPTFVDWSPRIGVAYDLFGNSKTAIKGSVGRYPAQEFVSLSTNANPLSSQTDLRTWTDSNRDDIAQLNEIGPSRNTQFGLARGRNVQDPNMERRFNWLYNVTVEHQILARMSLTAGYHHREYKNLTWTNNTLVTADDYTLVNVADPRGNGQTIPVYNLSRTKVGQVLNVDSNSDENKTLYNGYEVSLSARFGQGGYLITGMSSGLTQTKACQAAVSNPNVFRFCDQTEYDVPFRTQFKLSGSYPLPWGISAGAVFQSTPGAARSITYVVNRTIVPQLSLSSVTVTLNESGSLYLERLNQLDLRFSKTIRYRATRIQPQLSIFNLTNSATILTQNNSFGPALDRVQKVLDGRLVRLGVQVDF